MAKAGWRCLAVWRPPPGCCYGPPADPASLGRYRLQERAGFSPNFARVADLEINLIAFKGAPDPDNLRLFGIS